MAHVEILDSVVIDQIGNVDLLTFVVDHFQNGLRDSFLVGNFPIDIVGHSDMDGGHLKKKFKIILTIIPNILMCLKNGV